MTVAIIDLLICGEGFGIWMCGERRCLVQRFDIGEVDRRIIMLVRFEKFIEGFEHSDLGGVSVMFLRFGNGGRGR